EGNMLSCVAACSRRLNGEVLDEDGCGSPRSPASREAIKNLTTQIKDVALRLSGSYRYTKPRATGQSVLRGSKDDVLRVSNSSSSGTPKFLIALEQLDNEREEKKEWISNVEPGVIITLLSLKGGGNELKRIRFSREMFNKTQAQLWWAENHEKVMELYNVRPNANHQSGDLPRSDDEERNEKIQESAGKDSPVPPPPRDILPRSLHADLSDDLQSISDNHSMKSATILSELEQEKEEEEWVEEDEPGVFITIYSSRTGVREVKRLKFSREKFSEIQARLWWEDNRHRIQEQYTNGHDM
ncbi:hypothetical protein KI387_018694, partial [Taxus chinensis]